MTPPVFQGKAFPPTSENYAQVVWNRYLLAGPVISFRVNGPLTFTPPAYYTVDLTLRSEDVRHLSSTEFAEFIQHGFSGITLPRSIARQPEKSLRRRRKVLFDKETC